jgi:hypothetical protein
LNERTYQLSERLGWDGEWGGEFEIFQTYNNAGKVTEYKHYGFDWDNNKVGQMWNKYTFNTNNELTKEERYSGDWVSQDNWSLRETLLYEYENGVRTSLMSYFLDIMRPGRGWELEMDFAVPFNDLLIWANIYGDPEGEALLPYKTNVITHYFANWDQWGDVEEFLTNTWTYYWTQVEIDMTSIQDDIATDLRKAVTVYPNPVKDMLHIQTEQTIQSVFVFDLSGKLLIHVRGNQQTINLQSLQTGNYIVRIHTDKTIVPVKIVKQ